MYICASVIYIYIHMYYGGHRLRSVVVSLDVNEQWNREKEIEWMFIGVKLELAIGWVFEFARGTLGDRDSTSV